MTTKDDRLTKIKCQDRVYSKFDEWRNADFPQIDVVRAYFHNGNWRVSVTYMEHDDRDVFEETDDGFILVRRGKQ